MIALQRLAALALGDLAPDEEREIEEHVLGCDACADALARLVRVGDAVRALIAAGGGARRIFATRALVEDLERASAVTRRYTLGPNETVACTVDAHDVFVLAHFQADLVGVQRVDVLAGGERLVDVPFAADGVRVVVPGEELRHVPTMHIPMALVAVDAAGGERPIASYTFAHTAFDARAE